MIRKIVLILAIAILAVAFMQAVLNQPETAYAAAPTVQLSWSNPMQVYDVAVSANGNYLAAVNNTGLHYFDADNQNPKWWYPPIDTNLMSIAISADGDYIVAGDSNGYLHYFNQSTQRTGAQTTPTWVSIDMGGPVERGTLDMSANGNYTVVGGTGTNMWYYADCTKKTGIGNGYTWTSYVSQEFYTVHISANGKYVAGGGHGYEGGFVVFFGDADTLGGYPAPTWKAENQLTSSIMDLALSDDGYAVVAIDSYSGPATLYYWANATNLTDDPEATWTNPGAFRCVDTTANGDTVVAGGIYLTSVHYWTNARTHEGVEDEDWINLAQTNIYDIAISKDGSIIAAPAMDLPSTYSAHFLASDNTTIANITLPEFANMVSMSADGTTTAMAGPGYDSLYLFKADTTPPSINLVYQQPDKNDVYPNSTVRIFANITDDQSGVMQAVLNYTTGNGTWFTQTMDTYETDIWNGTIPAFPYCTTITYIIMAEDYAGNTITTLELELALSYHVIPEYAPTILMLLLITATSTSLMISKRRTKQKISPFFH